MLNNPGAAFSVIIPTLNEEKLIEKCLTEIRRFGSGIEIIVADGGSTDGTLRIAQRYGLKTCVSQSSRGIQCNAGASLAGGEVLVFLHADTVLPADAFNLLERHFQNTKTQIGTFQLSFDYDHWLLNLYCLPSRFELGLTRFGDQCIVVRKSFFKAIGGFPDWPLFEDLGFVRGAGKFTRVYRFKAKVKTSARRFLINGILRQQILNIWLILLYLIGVTPRKLAVYYARYNKAG